LSYHVTLTGVSDIGRIRKRNEDSLSLLPALGVALVADGMGGHPGGDVASRVAVDTARHSLDRLLRTWDPDSALDPGIIASRLGRAMAESVLLAHEAVRAEGDRVPELSGMGTTFTALAIDAATGAFGVGHVGDSRAYLFREGLLTQLTHDDTWVQQRVDSAQLTLDQARRHPFGHILTQCLGLEESPEPHVVTGRVVSGDAYLLCTDGLVGMVDDDDVTAMLRRHVPDGEAAARGLVDAAKERGGFDNITVALALVQ
jgi:PPM family protein phosphatase